MSPFLANVALLASSIFFILAIIGGIFKPKWITCHIPNGKSIRIKLLSINMIIAILLSFSFGILEPTTSTSAEKSQVESGTHQTQETATTPASLIFNVSIDINKGKPIVNGKTNLPEGTRLMASLSFEDNLSAQGETKVKDGSFSFGPFSSKGNPLSAGNYMISISRPLWRLQPESVRKKVKDIALKGEYVQDGRIDYESSLVIPMDKSSGVDRKAKIESARKEAATLYDELMSFRHDDIFLQYGFSQANPKASKWLEKAETLRDRFDNDNDIPYDLKTVPADLMTMGLEYLHNNGNDTTVTKDLGEYVLDGIKRNN